MSDFNSGYLGGGGPSPRALAIERQVRTPVDTTDIEKARYDAWMSSGYFCGETSVCDCDYAEQAFLCIPTGIVTSEAPDDCGTGTYITKGDPNCIPWWGGDGGDCANGKGKNDDPIAVRTHQVLNAIDETYNKGLEALQKQKLSADSSAVLDFSNNTASDSIYDSMLDSTESILVGMIYTLLGAGAVAGAIAGASIVFHTVLTGYVSSANGFIASFKPYNPPPIGGGGGLS